MTQLVKNLPAMWETWVLSQGWEDALEKGKATCWSFNGLEPGGPEPTIRKEERERERLISPGLCGEPIKPCS